jgi:hypothetical protein
MSKTSKPRAPLVRVEVALSWRFDLGAPPTAPTSTVPRTLTVRELARTEVEPVLGQSPTLRRRADELDTAAPHGWRCFVAFDQGRPVHTSFVELCPERPLLFGVVTEPASRRSGAFRAAFLHLAASVRETGETRLYSSASLLNRASVGAHRAVGFKVVRRTFDAFVLGVSLRGLVRRVVRR